MTEPLKDALFFKNSGLSRYPKSTLSALKDHVFSLMRLVVTPISPNNEIRLFTSSISGIFSIITSSGVNRTAQIICNASFLAPCGIISPFKRQPPSIINDAMVFSF